MYFSYKGKDASGKTVTGELYASSRAEALQKLKARGVMPLSLISGNAQTAAKKKNTLLPALLVLCLIGVGTLFLVRKPVKQVPQKKAATPQKTKVETSLKKTEVKPVEHSSEAAQRVQSPPPKTEVSAPVAQVPEKELSTPRKRAFESRGENILHMLVSVVPGETPPPIPNFPRDENWGEILKRDILVYSDDTEATIAAKENVAVAKRQLEKHLADGGTPEDFLSQYRNWLVKVAKERRELKRTARRILKEEGEAAAQAFVEKCNRELAEDDIKPITLVRGAN